jgi:hypothetical protein
MGEMMVRLLVLEKDPLSLFEVVSLWHAFSPRCTFYRPQTFEKREVGA